MQSTLSTILNVPKNGANSSVKIGDIIKGEDLAQDELLKELQLTIEDKARPNIFKLLVEKNIKEDSLEEKPTIEDEELNLLTLTKDIKDTKADLAVVMNNKIAEAEKSNTKIEELLNSKKNEPKPVTLVGIKNIEEKTEEKIVEKETLNPIATLTNINKGTKLTSSLKNGPLKSVNLVNAESDIEVMPSKSIKLAIPHSIKGEAVAVKYGQNNVKKDSLIASKAELLSGLQVHRGESIIKAENRLENRVPINQVRATNLFANQQKVVGGSIIDTVANVNSTANNVNSMVLEDRSIFKVKDLNSNLLDLGSDNLESLRESALPLQLKNSTIATNTPTNITPVKADVLTTTNNVELISKISDFIQQNSVGSKERMDIAVHDDTLGNFKLTAMKGRGGEGMQLDIQAATKEGHRFFVEQENVLLTRLNDAGIKVSSFKVAHSSDVKDILNVTSKESASSDSLTDGSSKDQNGHMAGRKDSQNSDSERRRMLWEMFKNRKEA